MSTEITQTLPIRVALVAVGDNNPQHTRALDLFDDSWRKLDVREYLTRDPFTGGVGHTENGNSATTQVAVFSMPEFPEFAISEFKRIIEGRRFRRLYACNRGMHRSDTLTRWLEQALNALKTTDGRQVFEARAFAMAEGYGKAGPTNIASNAISWMDKSWGWVSPVNMNDLESIYAYRNVGKVEKSARAWMAMWRFVQERGTEIAKSLIEERDAGAPQPKKAPRRDRGGARDPRWTEWADVKEEAESESRPPNEREDISNIEQARASNDEHRATNADRGRASTDEYRATHDVATQTDRVMWNQWDPANWHHILKDAGCDALAIDTFMLMAQLPHDQAKCHANQIISYLRCKEVREPSRLVHRWAIDARKKVLSKMEYEGYIDTRRW